MENIQEEIPNSSQPDFLPKPELIEDKKKLLRKSLINLAIYAFIFLFFLRIEVIYAAALLIVLLIHEFGHFLAMKIFKISNQKLFTLPFLGNFGIENNTNDFSQRNMSFVILAGPLPGIVIGIIILFVNQYYPSDRIEMLGSIFIGLNFFNLLPFMPLDGGRLLEILFIKQNHILRLIFTSFSILLLLILAFYYTNLLFLIIPVSMVFELITEVKNEKIRQYLLQEKINFTIEYKHLSNENYWFIRDCILLSFNKRYSMVQAGVDQYTIIEGSIMQHVISVLKSPIHTDLKIISKIAIMLLFTLSIIIPLMYFIPKALEIANSINIPK